MTMMTIAGQSFAGEQAFGPVQTVPPPLTEDASLAGSIDPPAGSRSLGAFNVQSGTQNYTCTNGTFSDSSTPEALLAGEAGVIHHFGGPTWELLADGSTVEAAKLADRPVSGAIPELLLEVTERSGQGLLTEATHIQRLTTRGGVAPSEACADGDVASVPYSALYVFWAAP
jgi:hypothetical protein